MGTRSSQKLYTCYPWLGLRLNQPPSSSPSPCPCVRGPFCHTKGCNCLGWRLLPLPHSRQRWGFPRKGTHHCRSSVTSEAPPPHAAPPSLPGVGQQGEGAAPRPWERQGTVQEEGISSWFCARSIPAKAPTLPLRGHLHLSMMSSDLEARAQTHHPSRCCLLCQGPGARIISPHFLVS